MTRFISMSRQRGFTLIEVLVAFLVMAIGLLGVIGLQNTAARMNFNSSSQIQAIFLAKEMADSVRANPQGVTLGSYNLVTGANVTSCNGTGCTPAQMATFDKYLWDKRIQESLGTDASGVVCIDSTPNDGSSPTSAGCDGGGTAWVVKLWWTEGSKESDIKTSTRGMSTADIIYRDNTQNVPSYYASFQP